MGKNKGAVAPKMRELFIEELADVHAGAGPAAEPCCTTYACCEEGPFGCCGIIDNIIVDPRP